MTTRWGKGGWVGLALLLASLTTQATESPQAPRFETPREAVTWRRDELKEIERLVRQLRFDLINNRDARGAAPRLAELAERARGERLLPAFIEGSHGRGSDARVRIWDEWEAFGEGFEALEARVADLTEAAEAEDYRQATRAFSELSLSCRSCHRRYKH
ncbi:cytochrome c [Halomonas sp. 328]|uniref:cytochrome c n=1 Tax=Halomonas sp. 328 TaxID=2776704 RepID=UPI0018A70F4E|nr:cytochrome c [Halomonas sp. 328]MBF8221630.1 cytochrome c [Halomonas sp. 328]